MYVFITQESTYLYHVKCGFAKYLAWFHYSIFHICLLCYIWICKFSSHACFHHSCIMSYICGFVIVLMHVFITQESTYLYHVICGFVIVLMHDFMTKESKYVYHVICGFVIVLMHDFITLYSSLVCHLKAKLVVIMQKIICDWPHHLPHLKRAR
jgi:hypothetical protein